MARKRTTEVCMNDQSLTHHCNGWAKQLTQTDLSIDQSYKVTASLRLDRRFLEQSNIYRVHTTYISSNLRRHQTCQELCSNRI